MENQIVVFELNSEYFGVDIAKVESIIKMQPITQMPHTSSFVEGVTNLRGKVLPVIDLRKRFSLPAEEFTKDTRIVVVEIPATASGIGVKGTMVGIVVDGVSEVLRVNTEAVEPPSPIVTTVDSLFICGIAKIAERLVILLDVDKVLSADEKASLHGLPASLPTAA
jgi:purine-binding chemotaxis protein CheW